MNFPSSCSLRPFRRPVPAQSFALCMTVSTGFQDRTDWALVHHMLRVWHWTCQQTEQELKKLVHRHNRRANGRVELHTIAVCCVKKGDAFSDGKVEDLLQLCIHALLIPPEQAHGVCTTEHTCT